MGAQARGSPRPSDGRGVRGEGGEDRGRAGVLQTRNSELGIRNCAARHVGECVRLGLYPRGRVARGDLAYQEFRRLPREDEAVVLRTLLGTFISRSWCLREPCDGTAMLTTPRHLHRCSTGRIGYSPHPQVFRAGGFTFHLRAGASCSILSPLRCPPNRTHRRRPQTASCPCRAPRWTHAGGRSSTSC